MILQKYVLYHSSSDKYLGYDSTDGNWVWTDEEPFLLVPGVVESICKFCFHRENSGHADNEASGELLGMLDNTAVMGIMVYPCDYDGKDYTLLVDDGELLSRWI